ncbi:MAG: tetratricopeptide repeat protein [Candidatus Obscuribacterales bacterium]|nr:tetratricopeptide repeat protein [Candidatus Obscuribacterales bacterium]
MDSCKTNSSKFNSGKFFLLCRALSLSFLCSCFKTAEALPSLIPDLEKTKSSTKINAIFKDSIDRKGLSDEIPVTVKDLDPSDPQLKKCLSQANGALEAADFERAEKLFQFAQKRFPKDLRAPIGLARIQYIKGQYQKALLIAEELSARYPLADEAQAMLGNIYFSQGEMKKAEEAFKIAAALNPEDSLSRYRLAQISMLYNDKAEAYLQLNDALRADPKNNSARVLLSRLLFEDQRANQALLELNGALENDPKNPVLLEEQTALLLANGKSQDALESILQAYQQNNESAEIQKQWMSIYGQRHDWPNARDHAESWRNREMDNPYAHLALAWCSLMNSEFEDAGNEFKAALKIVENKNAKSNSSQRSEIHNLYGMMLFDRRKIEEALTQFNKAVAGQPDYLPALLNRAGLYGFSNRYDKATEELYAIELKFPQSDDAKALHAWLAAREGDFKTAEESSRKALELNKNNELALITRAALFRQEGKLSESRYLLERISKTSNNSALPLCELSKTFLMQSDSGQAIEMAQQALQIAPANVDAKLALARALNHQKNYEGAILLLKECVSRNPKDLSIRMLLSKIQLLSGEKEFSQLTLEKAHSSFPNSAEPLKGLAQIASIEKKYAEAESLLKEAASYAPADLEICRLQARNYLAWGKCSEALEQFNSFGKSDMQSEDYLILARAANRMRDFDKSLAAYRTVFAEKKQLFTANDLLDFAGALLANHQEAEAAISIKQAAEENPQLFKSGNQERLARIQKQLLRAIQKSKEAPALQIKSNKL